MTVPQTRTPGLSGSLSRDDGRDDPDAREGRMKDTRSFNDMARTIFAKAYPAIAAQIVGETGISKGVCLDIGCGCGHLGIAMAEHGAFDMTLLDPSEKMRTQAIENVTEAGLSKRVQMIQGCAEAIPLPDNSVDLAVSRGSVFFWKDQAQAFREIYRVLKPLGVAYIGGGFGSAELRDAVVQKMKERNQGKESWRETMESRIGPESAVRFRQTLEVSGVPGFRVEQSDDKGLWIIFKKEQAHGTV